MPDYGKDSDPEGYQRFLDSLHDDAYSRGGYGSSDHVAKPDPLADFPFEERPLDPDFAHEEAKRLADIEKKIIRKIRDYKPVEEYGLTEIKAGTWLEDRPYPNAAHHTRLFLPNNSVTGIGLGAIEFETWGLPNHNFSNLVGVDTEIQLIIRVHTDQATMQEVGRMSDPENLFSYYYFNRRGDYGKLVTLPPQLVGERKILNSYNMDPSHPNFRHYVQGEMTIGDFELAGMALQKLEDALTPPSDQGPATPADAF